jgi:putative ABC transport system substrate-binding protein
MIARRNLINAVGAGALAASLGAFSQQLARIWRVGFLWGGSRAAALESGGADAFAQGMRELGYVDGRDYIVESRFADGKYDRLTGLAAELVGLNVNVVVTAGAAATRAVQQVTTTVPIVFAVVNDAISTGFGKSLARPGGNITGLSRNTVDISPKHVELLRAIAPRLSRLAVLANPNNPSHPVVLRAIEAAARGIGRGVLPVEASSQGEIERGFATVRQAKAQAVIVGLDQFFMAQGRQIVQLALKHRLPTTYFVRDEVQLGGLMSYGPPWAEFYRRSASYVDKILKGANPGELPIEQPTTFELVINQKTARELGITIPQSVLLRADKVIA